MWRVLDGSIRRLLDGAIRRLLSGSVCWLLIGDIRCVDDVDLGGNVELDVVVFGLGFVSFGSSL